jgi:hypothetical protein
MCSLGASRPRGYCEHPMDGTLSTHNEYGRESPARSAHLAQNRTRWRLREYPSAPCAAQRRRDRQGEECGAYAPAAMWTAPEQAGPPARRRSLTASCDSRKGSRPRHQPTQCAANGLHLRRIAHSTGGRTCNDARRGRRDHVRESGKHPNNFKLTLVPGCRCGLVVVASLVQRARAAGDGRHALLPTEAAMGPAPTAPEGATKTRNAYVGWQIQRTAQRAARKK